MPTVPCRSTLREGMNRSEVRTAFTGRGRLQVVPPSVEREIMISESTTPRPYCRLTAAQETYTLPSGPAAAEGNGRLRREPGPTMCGTFRNDPEISRTGPK